jgi:tetratricopeptide (TPR) repeat protein
MSFFSGLYQYEIVMLVAGSLLFLACLILLVLRSARDKSIGPLFIFFAIAIVMIGFPAYSKIQISKDGVELEKNTNKLLQSPTNKSIRESVGNDVQKLSSREFTDPATLAALAKAQIALGDNSAAEQNVGKALQAAPQDSVALSLQERLQLDKDLVQFAAKVEQDPTDSAAKSQLSQAVAEAGKIQIASPITTANLARAQAALGNPALARTTNERALLINPNLKEALGLQEKLKM